MQYVLNRFHPYKNLRKINWKNMDKTFSVFPLNTPSMNKTMGVFLPEKYLES